MATATVSLTTNVTPGVTLSNPCSLDELQALGSPTVTVDSTTEIGNLLGLAQGYYEIVEPGTNALTNYTNAKAAYDRLVALTPTTTQRCTLVLFPGTYQLDSDWDVNTDYVNIVGVGHVILNSSSSNVLDYSGQNIQIKNLRIECGVTSSVGATKNSVVFKDCVLGTKGGNVAVKTALTSAYPRFDNCTLWNVGRSSGILQFFGTLSNCQLSGTNSILIGNGCIITRCVIEPTVSDTGGPTYSIYHTAYKASTLGGTNNIGTPYNVVDADISVANMFNE